MRTATFARFVAALTVVLGFVAPASAGFANVQWFRFPGYTHAQVTGGGQVFNDVFGTVDVTVTASGPFSFPSGISADAKTIKGGHLNAFEAANNYHFAFSQPLELIVQYKTVDNQEMATIIGGSNPASSHNFGAVATLTPVAGGVQVVGNGTGQDPVTGASNGEVKFAATNSLDISHIALGARKNKFEYFMIGVQVVPEPTSMSLLGITLLGGLAAFRRRG